MFVFFKSTAKGKMERELKVRSGLERLCCHMCGYLGIGKNFGIGWIPQAYNSEGHVTWDYRVWLQGGSTSGLDSLRCFQGGDSSHLAAHAALPLAGNLQARLVGVHDQEGGGGQLKVVLPDQLLD